MIALLIYFIVLVILFSVAWYVLNAFVADPQIRKLLSVVLVVIATIIVVYILLSLIGVGGFHPPRINSLFIAAGGSYGIP